MELSKFYAELVKEIQLSKTATDSIEKHFETIANIIHKNLNNASTFPQGSYSLGTAIKPLNGSQDDYDADMVVLINDDINAKELKNKIGEILKGNKIYADKIEEKGRAWTITYSNSHIDIIPALKTDGDGILITNKNENGTYDYIKSNPRGYKCWFVEQASKKSKELREISNEKLHSVQPRTVLQKVIQILKYSRDKMFQYKNNKLKPISMLITTLASELYSGEEDLFEALENIISAIPTYMIQHKNIDGEYHIYNPVEPTEEFTDKWIAHPERKEEFIKWTKAIQIELVEQSQTEPKVRFAKRLQKVLGAEVINAYKAIGEHDQAVQRSGGVYFDSTNKTVGFSNDGLNESVPRNTFFGKE